MTETGKSSVIIAEGLSIMKKSNRVLELLYRLLQGERVNKAEYAQDHGIDVRSAERDVQTIREVIADVKPIYSVEIDKDSCYFIDHLQQKEFTAMEVLFISKVLLSSRSLPKDEMTRVIYAMNSLFPPEIRSDLKAAIQNELNQYIEPVHGKNLLDLHWKLNQALRHQNKVIITYHKVNGDVVTRTVLPISVVSSEYYLYLVGFFAEKDYRYPAFFRLDRIEQADIMEEHFSPRLYTRYNMGKMKHCIQFMYAGDLMKVKIAVKPRALEAVRDRLPNHKMVGDYGEGGIGTAEVFDEGVGV